jgi:hypothetical protein
MSRLRIGLLAAGFWAFFAADCAFCAKTQGAAPDFKEVYDLVHAHLAGVSEAELNRAAVQGLVSVLGPKVSIVSKEPSEGVASELLISKAAMFEGSIAYLRVSRIAEGLEQAVSEALGKLIASNRCKGLVLDLRFAGGQAYNTTAAVADLFLSKEKPLLDWGKGMTQSKEKSQVIASPVAVLINARTAGAAEALAAVLRETGAGLLLGGATAGQAMIAEEYPLNNGDRLCIATAPIRLGDGSSLTSAGVRPDINVAVSLQEEQAFYGDVYKNPRVAQLATNTASSTNQAASTNRTRKVRFNEAELVRERREGVYPETDLASGRGTEAEAPIVQDPVLARALDVLKGLAVVRGSRS